MPEPDPLDVAIGSLIRQLRLDKGVTQEQLGGAMEVSFQQIQKYEKGTNRISVSGLIKVAAFLDVSPTLFLDVDPLDRRTDETLH